MTVCICTFIFSYYNNNNNDNDDDDDDDVDDDNKFHKAWKCQSAKWAAKVLDCLL